MRYTRHLFVSAALVIGALPPTSALAQRSGPASTVDALRGIVATIDSVRWGVTCDEWRAGRPAARCEPVDSVRDRTTAAAWCYRGVDDRRRRRVFFYAVVPGPRPACRLLEYRVEIGPVSRHEWTRAGDRLHEILAHRYGVRSTTEDSARSSSLDPRHWRTNRLEFVAYVDDWFSDRRMALTVRDRGVAERIREARAVRNDLYVSGIHAPALDSLTLRYLTEHAPDLEAQVARTRSSRDAERSLELLRRLLEAADTAPPYRRALLLFAADRTASHIAVLATRAYYADSSSTPRIPERMDSLGVPIGMREPAAEFFYDHRLLMRVWTDAPGTAPAVDAFRLMQRRGWDGTGTCDSGEDQYRSVVRHGRAFLAGGAHGPLATETHFLLAAAFETEWSLARAPSHRYGIRPSSDVGADSARAQAIAHYEAVLERAPNSRLARYARWQLPRLMLRVDTGQRWFYCRFD